MGSLIKDVVMKGEERGGGWTAKFRLSQVSLGSALWVLPPQTNLPSVGPRVLLGPSKFSKAPEAWGPKEAGKDFFHWEQLLVKVVWLQIQSERGFQRRPRPARARMASGS